MTTIIYTIWVSIIESGSKTQWIENWGGYWPPLEEEKVADEVYRVMNLFNYNLRKGERRRTALSFVLEKVITK